MIATMRAPATELKKTRGAAVPRRQDDAAWAAVLKRDAGRDGDFVYAVRTTGVYCRPSCPSRRPLRRNVEFFGGPDAAESAGFRACRRCHPRAERSTTEVAVARVQSYLEHHVDERVTLETLARVAKLSPYHLQRSFKRLLGVSPKRYASALRADRMKAELRRGATVSRATFEAGYGASSRAYHAADQHLGMTPAKYRRGGRGVEMRFATAASPVGRLLVAATSRGVCSVMLGEDDASLEAALTREYPHAKRERVDVRRLGAEDPLRVWTESIARYLAGREDQLAVPTDVGGTLFQERVWRELGTIPFGETRSYSQVAASIGAPTAARAVAQACASNRLALVIPCHRVVRESGDPGGYRLGLGRKRKLLAQEHAVLARRLPEPARAAAGSKA